MTTTQTITTAPARSGHRRRRRMLLGALALALAIVAGYGVWTTCGPTRCRHRSRSTFTPVVLAVEPGRKLRWIGRVGPGKIFDGEHTFTIRQVRPGVVRFTQREAFTGVAVPFYEHWLHTDTLPMFRAMDAALAHEVGSHG